jgi:anaerobic C4-dicarboxylate transporter
MDLINCFGYVSLPIDASMTWLTTIPLDKVIHFITKLKINYEQNSLLLEKTFRCMFDLKSHTQHWNNLTTSHHAIMKLSTSIVTKAVTCLLILALAVTTQVVNGEKIIVNCRMIIPYFLLSVMSIASFLFDTHPNIILHASRFLSSSV